LERARLWWSDEGAAARQHVVALVTLSSHRLVALLGFIIQSTTRMKNLFYACMLEIGEAMRRSDLRAVGDSHSLFLGNARAWSLCQQEKASVYIYNLNLKLSIKGIS
jgi:hypothetical protein